MSGVIGRLFRRGSEKKKAGGKSWLRRVFSMDRLMGLGLIAVFLVVYGADPYPVQFVRAKTFDMFQRMKPRQLPPPPPKQLRDLRDVRVTIVDLDEDSLSEVGQWPWPRTTIAKMVQNLMQMGALVVAFDVVFAEPDRMNPAGVVESMYGLDAETKKKLLKLTKTMRETPANATHWSVRSMARAVGISYTSVQNIWREHGLKPHLVDTFKVSNDPAFAEKVEDVVGLYLDPPDKAVVFSVDEKSQIQALDRTQPGLPIKKGRAGTMTHDYKRNGTTTLFAALNVLDGKVIGQCMKRHRHQEFIRFLNRIDRQTLPYLDIHLIIDNYGAHKTPEVKRWLKKHPRFHIHFTPTSASWLNMIERFFAEITRKRIRRGAFKSLAELEQAIYDYLAKHNQNPVPFVWTATAKAILEKAARAKQTLETVRAGTKC